MASAESSRPSGRALPPAAWSAHKPSTASKHAAALLQRPWIDIVRLIPAPALRRFPPSSATISSSELARQSPNANLLPIITVRTGMVVFDGAIAEVLITATGLERTRRALGSLPSRKVTCGIQAPCTRRRREGRALVNSRPQPVAPANGSRGSMQTPWANVPRPARGAHTTAAALVVECGPLNSSDSAPSSIVRQ